MKKLVFSFVLLSLALACQTNQTPKPSPQAGEALRTIPVSFAESSANFAFKLWPKVDQFSENHFLSPLSLQVALGMLLNGTEGDTKREIAELLGGNTDLNSLNIIYQNLMENLPQVDPSVQLSLANSVWYRQEFDVQKPYLETLGQYFKASAQGQNFSDPATVTKINEWASKNTAGKIPMVLEKINDNQVLFLLNALYFKGDWRFPFDPKQTYDAPFTGVNKKKIIAKMMQTEQNFRYTQQSNYQAIELPYGQGNNYNMTILLPNADQQISDFLKGFSAKDWTNLQKNLLQETKVQLGLPKFTLKYETQLASALKEMGMPTAFEPGKADLSKIAPPLGRLFVDFIKQNTFVAVDEKGTEAAAVTTIGVGLTSIGPNPARFICDHPFAFVISEKNSNTILFLGKIVEPIQP